MSSASPARKFVRSRRRRGAVAGVVATAVALGVAELVAAISRTFRSPLVDVGNRVIDAAPRWVKEFAITTFGSNDKRALLIGMAILLLVYAVIIGILGARRRWVGPVGVAAFGVIGVVSAMTGATGSVAGAVPTVVGAIAGGAAIWYLTGLAARPVVPVRTAADGSTDGRRRSERDEPDEDETTVETPVVKGREMPRQRDKPDEDDLDEAPTLAPVGRRTFLIGAAALGGVALVAGATGRWLSGRFDVAAERARLLLPRARRALPPVPKDVAFDIDGLTPFTTPLQDFYRVDTAISLPQVPVESWQLKIFGMVDNPITLSFDELTRREVVESDITLTCVSNEIGGNLAGHARWLGVRLDDLLKEAKPKRGVDQVVGRSVDGFTAGFPLSVATDGRDALVAFGMNGEPLPVAHGFPARLIVPGIYGYVSATKWLTEIELTTFDAFDAYWVARDWSANGTIKTFSRIDTPGGLSTNTAGRHPIAGVAWAQGRGISKVDVRVDGGAWRPAQLAAELNNVSWRQWMMPFDFARGRHTIECRATDGTGAIQTEQRSEPFPDGASGWHSIVVITN